MSRLVRRLAAAAAALALVACADTPAEPASSEAPSASILEIVNPSEWANTLTRDRALGADVVVTKVIGRNGGRIEIPSAGFRLDVPNGAVSRDTRFVVTAIAGDQVAYDFQPHGTVFARPLRFEQELRGTSFDWRRHRALEGGYFAGRGALDTVGDIALISEFLPASLDLHGSKVRFDIRHFSGYLVATGRRGPRLD